MLHVPLARVEQLRGTGRIDAMIATRSRTARPSFPALAGAVAMIVIVSLSIHVVMLQVFRVPYPEAKGLGNWGLFYPFAQSLGLVALAATRCRGCVVFTPSRADSSSGCCSRR